MTEPEVAALSASLGDVVRDVVTSAVAGIRDRVVNLESRPDPAPVLAALSARVAIVESLPPILAAMSDRVLAIEARAEASSTSAIGVLRDLGAIRERVALVEAREPVAGPPGPMGPPGVDGKDGAPGLRYLGVFVEGKAYEPGDGVTWAGSMWHCNAATATRPGDTAKAWTLTVKRGRDGRDGAAGPMGPPGPPGRDLTVSTVTRT
jgi:hypothetical protein